MGMGTMLKECVHSMMGSHKDVSDEKAEEMLQEMINSAPVVIFSKPTCPYCMDTKSTLDRYDAKYRMIDMHEVDSSVAKALKRQTGQRTVPNIFIAGKHIGGNSDLQGMNSILKATLQDAHAI